MANLKPATLRSATPKLATLKRGLGLLLVVFALLVGAGGAARADDGRPNIPPPGNGPSLNVSPPQTGDAGNSFQRLRSSCDHSNAISNAATAFGDALLGGAGPLLRRVIQAPTCLGAATLAHPIDALSTGISSVASAFWGDSVGKFAKSVLEGNTQAFGLVMTFWMSVPMPSVAGNKGIAGIRYLTWEVELVAFAIGFSVAAMRIVIARRHATAEGATETAQMIGRTIFAAAALPALVALLHVASDSFSTWVIQQATDNDPADRIKAIVWIDDKTGLGPIAAMILAGIGLLGSIAQLVALLIREAVLAVVVGLAPIAAASSATNTGKHTWSSMTSFVIAALLFKPVASLIYAYAFWAASGQSAADAVTGAVLLAVAGLSMPAMVRVIAPAAASISAGGGHGAFLAGATGAIAGGLAGGMRSSGASLRGANATSVSSPPASGARGGSSYGGRYSGSTPASNSTGSRTGAAVRGAGKGVGTAAAGVGAVAGMAATAARMTHRGVTSAAHFADGAIGNYHGQVHR